MDFIMETEKPKVVKKKVGVGDFDDESL